MDQMFLKKHKIFTFLCYRPMYLPWEVTIDINELVNMPMIKIPPYVAAPLMKCIFISPSSLTHSTINMSIIMIVNKRNYGPDFKKKAKEGEEYKNAHEIPVTTFTNNFELYQKIEVTRVLYFGYKYSYQESVRICFLLF